jgi:RNA polymerase sigma factor (sigma-70 family)
MSPWRKIFVYIGEKKRNKEGEQNVMTLNSPPDGLTHDQEALPPFETFYERYHVQVYRYLYAHLKHEHDAADLMQQVFFQAWKHRQAYDPGRGTVATWLLGIAHHRLIDFYRLSRPSISWESLPEVPATDGNPEAMVLSEESMALIRKILEALPQPEQDLLALRFAARLSSAEIATLIGKSEAATKKQMTRLLRRLQEQYRRQELETPLPDLLPAFPAFVAALHRVYIVSPPTAYTHDIHQSLLELIVFIVKGRHLVEKINLHQKFALFSEHWNPKIVGELNNFAVKIVKVQGEFVWHHHEVEDELFFVVKGRLLMQVRETPEQQHDIWVEEGELIIIPHGVEHRPVALEETQLMLLEPKTTVNTGNVQNERTVPHVERL